MSAFGTNDRWEDTLFMDVTEYDEFGNEINGVDSEKNIIYLSDEGTIVNKNGDEVTNISADSVFWMDDLRAEGCLEVESFEEL